MKRISMLTLFMLIGLGAATMAAANDDPNLNPMLPNSGGVGYVDAAYSSGSITINDTVVQFSPIAKLRAPGNRTLFPEQLKVGDQVLFNLDENMQIIILMKLK